MMYVKSGRNKDAIASATRVIDEFDDAAEGIIIKAYYWRGTAYYNRAEHSQCVKDCVAATKRSTGNKATRLRKLYKKAMAAMKSVQAKEKRLFRGAFDKVPQKKWFFLFCLLAQLLNIGCFVAWVFYPLIPHFCCCCHDP